MGISELIPAKLKLGVGIFSGDLSYKNNPPYLWLATLIPLRARWMFQGGVCLHQSLCNPPGKQT